MFGDDSLQRAVICHLDFCAVCLKMVFSEHLPVFTLSLDVIVSY